VTAAAPPTPPETGASRNPARARRAVPPRAARCRGQSSTCRRKAAPEGAASPMPARDRGPRHWPKMAASNHHFARCRRLRGRVRALGAEPHSRVESRRGQVKSDRLKPLLEEVGEHRLTHGSGPDEPDLHFPSPPQVASSRPINPRADRGGAESAPPWEKCLCRFRGGTSRGWHRLSTMPGPSSRLSGRRCGRPSPS
jgi:hypothetical protein